MYQEGSRPALKPLPLPPSLSLSRLSLSLSHTHTHMCSSFLFSPPLPPSPPSPWTQAGMSAEFSAHGAYNPAFQAYKQELETFDHLEHHVQCRMASLLQAREREKEGEGVKREKE